MESAKLISLIDVLDDNIDDLEEVLIPVLKGSLSETALKLPLLDKAQLYILVTYAIESILFSYLRINGVNAKEHSVFRELTRVKQYFEKIKAANSAVSKPNVRLDRVAAGRFIKHALAGGGEHNDSNAEIQKQVQVSNHPKNEDPSTKRKFVNGDLPPVTLRGSSSASPPVDQVASRMAKEKRTQQ